MAYLYEISTKHPNPIHADKAWKKSLIGGRFCAECNSLNRSMPVKIDSIVLDSKPDFRICGGVWFTRLEIYHTDLVSQIEKHIDNIKVIDCFLPSGEKVSDYVGLVSEDWIFLRGDAKRRYKACSTCGFISQSHIDRYVLRSYLSRKHVYLDQHSSLFISEHLASKIDTSKWPDALIEEVPIYDEPLDNQHLPFDPPYIKEKYPEGEWKYTLNKRYAEQLYKRFSERNPESYK